MLTDAEREEYYQVTAECTNCKNIDDDGLIRKGKSKQNKNLENKDCFICGMDTLKIR